jgi:hypothetical protein
MGTPMGRVATGLDGFEGEAEGQRAYFESRSPCHAAFLRHVTSLLAERGEVRSAVLAAWEGRSFRARYERPLLLCAAVRLDALCDPSHPLAAALSVEPPNIGAIRADAVREAVLRPSVLSSLRSRFVQTNEVTRACVWRLPIGLVAGRRPCILADLGCSAGLNLIADRLDLTWRGSDGAPLALLPARVVGRFGFDRAPVDVRDEGAMRWLRACLWPGQTERLYRFEQAVRFAREASDRGEMHIEVAEATEMPARLERLASSDAVVFAYQTVVLDYLLPPIRDRYLAAMTAWILAHPRQAFWAEFERSPATASAGPAEIRVHFAKGHDVRTLSLAGGEYHPETLHLDGNALAELAADFGDESRVVS